MEHLHEISCGTYQPELSRQYTTNIVNQAANANGPNNQTIQAFNHPGHRRQPKCPATIGTR